MKSIWKYITGFVSFVIGILVLSNKKAKKVKEIDDAIKEVEKDIKKINNKKDAYRKTLESKKQALKQIKKQKFKKKDIGTKEAADFLKGFSKGKKK